MEFAEWIQWVAGEMTGSGVDRKAGSEGTREEGNDRKARYVDSFARWSGLACGGVGSPPGLRLGLSSFARWSGLGREWAETARWRVARA